MMAHRDGSKRRQNADSCSAMQGVFITVISTRLSNIIVWCGGSPLPPLEDIVLPIALRDLDPLVRTVPVDVQPQHRLREVKSLLTPSLFAELPNGWSHVSEYRHTPDLHLRYEGSGLTGTFFEGQIVNVFICIATSGGDEPHEMRALYVRHMPIFGEDSHRFSQAPFNSLAAWLTLYVWGSTTISTSWKTSHDVEGYLTLGGEVRGAALV